MYGRVGVQLHILKLGTRKKERDPSIEARWAPELCACDGEEINPYP
jgi:hypothetical protein